MKKNSKLIYINDIDSGKITTSGRQQYSCSRSSSYHPYQRQEQQKIIISCDNTLQKKLSIPKEGMSHKDFLELGSDDYYFLIRKDILSTNIQVQCLQYSYSIIIIVDHRPTDDWYLEAYNELAQLGIPLKISDYHYPNFILSVLLLLIMISDHQSKKEVSLFAATKIGYVPKIVTYIIINKNNNTTTKQEDEEEEEKPNVLTLNK
ncbi:hypothetical protein DFA_02107 [Cavenderia fasciculata]|uniref:Uncharacterized protein n=1 Tax=Cavenderia fasciculata TaxID=261658 RepID=F4PYQ4_CACFS|nr:uncharacterized protein DFA_02107 [Cavenderia fasciculata]EGG19320.1 hypothetical protein DFA_02107 [Cavenderia fasciculata]|eukprot:XP_004357591.1 hypothetical protein DFA_02107 [Cavenderia fasciculata]